MLTQLWITYPMLVHYFKTVKVCLMVLRTRHNYWLVGDNRFTVSYLRITLQQWVRKIILLGLVLVIAGYRWNSGIARVLLMTCDFRMTKSCASSCLLGSIFWISVTCSWPGTALRPVNQHLLPTDSFLPRSRSCIAVRETGYMSWQSPIQCLSIRSSA